MKSRLKPYQQFNLTNRLVPSNNTVQNQPASLVTVSTEIKRTNIPKYLNNSVSGSDKFYVFRKSSLQSESDSNKSCQGSSTHLSYIPSQSSQPIQNPTLASKHQYSHQGLSKGKYTQSLFEKKKIITSTSNQNRIFDHFIIPSSVTNSAQISSNSILNEPQNCKSGIFQISNGKNMEKVHRIDKIQYDATIKDGLQNISSLNGRRNTSKIKPSNRYGSADEPEEEIFIKNNTLPSCATERLGFFRQNSSSALEISSQNLDFTNKISLLEKEVLTFKKALENWQTQEKRFKEEINKKQYQIKQLNLTKVNLNEQIKFLQLKLTNEKEGKLRQQQQVKMLSTANEELKLKNQELEKRINEQSECLECERKKQEQMEDQIKSLLNLKLQLDRYIKINRELQQKLEGQQQKIVSLSFIQAETENQLCLVKKNSCEETESLKFEIKKIGAENERLKTEIRIKQNYVANVKTQYLNKVALYEKIIAEIRSKLSQNAILQILSTCQAILNEKIGNFYQKIQNMASKIHKLSKAKLKVGKLNLEHFNGDETISIIEQKCKLFLSQVNATWIEKDTQARQLSKLQNQNRKLQLVIFDMSQNLYEENKKYFSIMNSKNKQILNLEVQIDDERVEKLKQIINLQEQKNTELELREELENNLKVIKQTEDRVKQLQSILESEYECLESTCEELIRSKLTLLNMKYRQE